MVNELEEFDNFADKYFAEIEESIDDTLNLVEGY